MLIKNEEFLHDEVSLGDKTTYVIKSQSVSGEKVFLGDVFNYLPHGIINKTVTGIGGTGCELDSKRNSIIVQPYNNTAKSKAKQLSINNKYNIVFYGKEDKTPSKKINTANLGLPQNIVSNLNLLKYIKECEKNGQPIKITCVTDQLEALKICLDTTSENKFTSFHLVLDEIDSLQEHSGFRVVMEKCFNLYKEHPKEQRTVISATLIEFSDPDMKHEAYTKIEYDHPTLKDIAVIGTKNIEEELIKQLIQLINTAKAPVLVACNHLDYCMKVINIIKKEASDKSKTIKILCSSMREKQVGKYFAGMPDNGKLPGDINFTTAAYFNGFDIYDKYHNIIVAEKGKPTLRLSSSLIYQISGRGRNGLLSNKLLLKITSGTNYTYYTFEQLFGTTKERQEVDDFIKKLKKSKNPLTVKAAEAIKNIYVEGTEDYPSVHSYDKLGDIVPSYFKIDNRLEQQKTHKSYLSFVVFKKTLTKHFNVTFEQALYITETDKKLQKPDILLLGKDLLNQLRKINRTENYTELIKTIRYGLLPIFTFQNLICDIYELGCNDESIDIDKLIVQIESCIKKKRTYLQELKHVKLYLEFKRYTHKIKIFKVLMESSFKLNSVLTKPELNKCSLDFAKLMKKLSQTENKDIKKIAKQICAQPTIIAPALIRLKKKHTNKKHLYTILGYDPFDIKIAGQDSSEANLVPLDPLEAMIYKQLIHDSNYRQLFGDKIFRQAFGDDFGDDK